MSILGMGKVNALQQVSNMPSPLIGSGSSKLKRRFEGDDDSCEVSLDSSPPPERLRKAAPKRSKMSQPKDNSKFNAADEVDLGVLLASLPPESLLPILNSLIKNNPSVKSSILSVLPRPTLNTAVEALSSASRQLRDAYPYSNTATHSFSTFGSPTAARPSSGFASRGGTDSSGMRETYIQSRLRPHIETFVATCMSYLPYFTLLPQQSHSILTKSPNTSPLSAINRDPSSINETYSFLFHLTSQILSQQPLTQATLIPMVLPRLSEEWMAWANRVDQHVNQHAGMFGTDVVNTWYRGLDDCCRAKPSQEFVDVMQNVRKKWIVSVGWLIGRFPSPEPMDV